MSPLRKAGFVVAVVGVATVAIALGRWQLRRLHARRAGNAVFLAAQSRPPLELPGALLHAEPVDSGRRILARGRFDTAGQVILREHVQNDAPGVQVVTPFVIDSNAGVLWVLRGFVRSPDAVTPPDSIALPLADDVVIGGLALAIPVTSDSGGALLHNGTTTWKRLDRIVLSRRRAGSLPFYLVLAGDSAGPGQLDVVAPPALTDGPHLSYAIQWFGIALAVLVFGAVMLWRDGRALPRPPAAP